MRIFHTLRVFLVAVAFLTAAGCSRVPLQVFVVDAATNQPIASAEVEIRPLKWCDPFAPRDFKARTDATGIAFLHTGPYWRHVLTVTSDRYASFDAEVIGAGDREGQVSFVEGYEMGEVALQRYTTMRQIPILRIRMNPH